MFSKYQKLRQSGLVVFDRKAIANLLGLKYASTTPVLDRLVRKEILLHLKRDCYVLPEALQEVNRKIANELVKPSYISLWTALHDAGVTTQVPRIVQSVTPKRSQTIEHETAPTFTYDHLPERLCFGYIVDEERVFRMRPEKALLDLLYVQQGMIDWESIDCTMFDIGTLRSMVKRFPPRVRRALRPFLFLQ